MTVGNIEPYKGYLFNFPFDFFYFICLFIYLLIGLFILFQPKPDIELCTCDITSFYKCQLSTDLHGGRTYSII